MAARLIDAVTSDSERGSFSQRRDQLNRLPAVGARSHLPLIAARVLYPGLFKIGLPSKPAEELGAGASAGYQTSKKSFEA